MVLGVFIHRLARTSTAMMRSIANGVAHRVMAPDVFILRLARGFEEARHCLAEWRATEELENEEID